MCKVIVFAGTTEGYEISRFLAAHRISVHSCVATEYGGRALEESEYQTVREGRLTDREMLSLFQEQKPQLVLDATHPYAVRVTENIRNACADSHIPYERVLRRESADCTGAVYVDSISEAVRYLGGTSGNILLTTGSKELAEFRALEGFCERVYARVLSLPSVMENCAALGLEGKHLIGMQGPFSRELNEAMLRQYDCRCLVTKESGHAGGFEEKLEAAFSCGATAVVIGRPVREEGMSVSDCKRLLIESFHLQPKQKVTLLGIGMGSENTLTTEGRRALEKADLLIGAQRMTEAVRLPHHSVYCQYRSGEIAEYIQEHPEYENIVIALSGDVGFYSGAKKLLALLGKDTEMICGISSPAYFMAKIKMSWDDAVIASSHGQCSNLISLIRHNAKVFAILGAADGVRELAKKLVLYGMGEVLLHVGENLSYPNEKIFHRQAGELTDYEGDTLSVVCACNERAVSRTATHGIRDGEFLRGKAPMTKEEIRSVSLSKLRLNEDSVCYDIGAGTGSVSVEMALRAYRGQVFAIEKKAEAVKLLKENKIKFAADNLEIIEGTAPEALENLPVPTHAFIGGSSGNLREILRLLYDKNSALTAVINCITLETLSEALEAAKAMPNTEWEVVQMSAARSKNAGPYHMMMGENPIYIITCRESAGKEE